MCHTLTYCDYWFALSLEFKLSSLYSTHDWIDD